MKTASVAELKARLSEYLAAAKRGEDVIVTERGRPIARLAALDEARSLDARMQELVRAGLVRPPQQKLPPDFFGLAAPPDPDGELLRALLEERAEGR